MKTLNKNNLVARFFNTLLFALAVSGFTTVATAAPVIEDHTSAKSATRAMNTFVNGRTVITLSGFSGQGYQDEARMLRKVAKHLSKHDPRNTVVNIGATGDGIGAAYGLAKKMGFATAGVVSSKAENSWISKDVDYTVKVKDETWGGVNAKGKLSPTSKAMVAVSHQYIMIGGGDVAAHEGIAAKSAGKLVRHILADANRAKVIATALTAGKPAPNTFRGEAQAMYRKFLASKRQLRTPRHH